MIEELEVLRTEKKYGLPHTTFIRLKRDLSISLKEDLYNQENGYLVRSLYFDSLYDHDYADKESGLEYRKKIRLRTYHPNAENVKLEMKEKQGQNQRKRSLTISKQQATRLIQGEYNVLKEIGGALAEEFYYTMQIGLYRPKTIVEYNRLAYMVKENNIRVTLDSQLRATEANYDLFSSELSLYPITDQLVLEVKYNHFLLDYIKDILNLSNKEEVAISKYCLARQMSYF